MSEAEPIQQSLLVWFYFALGFKYTVLLSLAGLGCFISTLLLVVRGKGPMAVASLILVVNIPLLIGLFAAFEGAMISYHMIATSATSPKPADVALGISTALAAPFVALLVMAPSYAVAAFGSMIRSFATESRSASS